MAAINIVLKAVDQYSSTLTGLNQGFELVGKAIESMKYVADIAWTAIKTGAEFAFNGVIKAVELASKGGALTEMRQQFANVADSYGVDAKRIILDLDRITLNMISSADAVRLASKGVQAGFNEQELSTLFTFVKRQTESTGEDFNSMAQTIISSIAKGRFSTLKEFGLIIESGAKVKDVFKELERATGDFGKTSFNTEDEVKALSNQFKKFFEEIGAAINNSSTWQSALTGLKQLAVDFIRGFDARPVTFAFNAIGDAAKGLYNVLEASGLVGWSKSWIEGESRLFNQLKKDWLDLFQFIYNQIAAFAQFQRENPIFSQKILGLNPEVWAEVENSLKRLTRIGVEAKKPATEAIKEITGEFKNQVDAQVAAFSGGSKSITNAATNAAAGYSSAWKQSSGNVVYFANETRRGVVDNTEKMAKSAKESIESVSQSYASGGTFMVGRIQQAAEAAALEVRRQTDSISSYIGATFNALNADLVQFTGETSKLVDDWTKDLEDMEKDLDELEKGLSAPLPGQDIVNQQSAAATKGGAADVIANANWPAEFQALGDFMFKWVLSVASGSSLPMAITTTL